jgi:hypothetical protein
MFPQTYFAPRYFSFWYFPSSGLLIGATPSPARTVLVGVEGRQILVGPENRQVTIGPEGRIIYVRES